MKRKKNIALVAHDNKKADLLEWIHYNRDSLLKHALIATGTTGRLIEEKLELPVECLLSGPVGGDQQLGARISKEDIDVMIFFWDPLEAQPHDPDVKALLRMAALWNIPVACNRASADFIISSPLMNETYKKQRPNFEKHARRPLDNVDALLPEGIE